MAQIKLRLRLPGGALSTLTVAGDMTVGDFTAVAAAQAGQQHVQILTGFPPKPVPSNACSQVQSVFKNGDMLTVIPATPSSSVSASGGMASPSASSGEDVSLSATKSASTLSEGVVAITGASGAIAEANDGIQVESDGNTAEAGGRGSQGSNSQMEQRPLAADASSANSSPAAAYGAAVNSGRPGRAAKTRAKDSIAAEVAAQEAQLREAKKIAKTGSSGKRGEAGSKRAFAAAGGGRVLGQGHTSPPSGSDAGDSGTGRTTADGSDGDQFMDDQHADGGGGSATPASAVLSSAQRKKPAAQQLQQQSPGARFGTIHGASHGGASSSFSGGSGSSGSGNKRCRIAAMPGSGQRLGSETDDADDGVEIDVDGGSFGSSAAAAAEAAPSAATPGAGASSAGTVTLPTAATASSSSSSPQRPATALNSLLSQLAAERAAHRPEADAVAAAGSSSAAGAPGLAGRGRRPVRAGTIVRRRRVALPTGQQDLGERLAMAGRSSGAKMSADPTLQYLRDVSQAALLKQYEVTEANARYQAALSGNYEITPLASARALGSDASALIRVRYKASTASRTWSEETVDNIPSAPLPLLLRTLATGDETTRDMMKPHMMAQCAPRTFWAVVRFGGAKARGEAMPSVNDVTPVGRPVDPEAAIKALVPPSAAASSSSLAGGGQNIDWSFLSIRARRQSERALQTDAAEALARAEREARRRKRLGLHAAGDPDAVRVDPNGASSASPAAASSSIGAAGADTVSAGAGAGAPSSSDAASAVSSAPPEPVSFGVSTCTGDVLSLAAAALSFNAVTGASISGSQTSVDEVCKAAGFSVAPAADDGQADVVVGDGGEGIQGGPSVASFWSSSSHSSSAAAASSRLASVLSGLAAALKLPRPSLSPSSSAPASSSGVDIEALIHAVEAVDEPEGAFLGGGAASLQPWVGAPTSLPAPSSSSAAAPAAVSLRTRGEGADEDEATAEHSEVQTFVCESCGRAREVSALEADLDAIAADDHWTCASSGIARLHARGACSAPDDDLCRLLGSEAAAAACTAAGLVSVVDVASTAIRDDDEMLYCGAEGLITEGCLRAACTPPVVASAAAGTMASALLDGAGAPNAGAASAAPVPPAPVPATASRSPLCSPADVTPSIGPAVPCTDADTLVAAASALGFLQPTGPAGGASVGSSSTASAGDSGTHTTAGDINSGSSSGGGDKPLSWWISTLRRRIPPPCLILPSSSSIPLHALSRVPGRIGGYPDTTTHLLYRLRAYRLLLAAATLMISSPGEIGTNAGSGSTAGWPASSSSSSAAAAAAGAELALALLRHPVGYLCAAHIARSWQGYCRGEHMDECMARIVGGEMWWGQGSAGGDAGDAVDGKHGGDATRSASGLVSVEDMRRAAELHAAIAAPSSTGQLGCSINDLVASLRTAAGDADDDEEAKDASIQEQLDGLCELIRTSLELLGIRTPADLELQDPVLLYNSLCNKGLHRHPTPSTGAATGGGVSTSGSSSASVSLGIGLADVVCWQRSARLMMTADPWLADVVSA